MAPPPLHARGLGDADDGHEGDPERIRHLLKVPDRGARDLRVEEEARALHLGSDG